MALGFHGVALRMAGGGLAAGLGTHHCQMLSGATVLFFLLLGVAAAIPGQVQRGPAPCQQTPSLGLPQPSTGRQDSAERESSPQVLAQGRVTVGIYRPLRS